MPGDLGKTQALWTRRVGREEASMLYAALRYLREVEDRFRRSREQMKIERTFPLFADAGATYAGGDPEVNATDEGRVYVRITGNSGARVVEWFRSTGGSNSVALAPSVADGNTATLVATNSSGLTGTWPVPATGGNTTGDELSFLMFNDFRKRLGKVYTETDGIVDDADSRDVASELYLDIANSVRTVRGNFIAGFPRVLLANGIDNPIASGNAFVSAQDVVLQADVQDEDSSNNVVRKRSGYYETLADSMEKETTAGAQSVVKRVPSAGAGAFNSNNTGKGALSSHTPGESCPPSVWTFKVVDDTIGEETFDVRISFTKDGDERVLTDTGLQIGKTWSGILEFGAVTLTRTFTKTNDGSNVNLAAVTSGVTVTGENSSNSPGGIVFWRIDAAGSNSDFSFYSTQTGATTGGEVDLVAKVSNVVDGAAFTAVQQNSSGLTIAHTSGSNPVDTTTGQLNYNVFLFSNSNKTPDEFTVTVTVAANPGLIQTILAEEIAGSPSLNSATLASETISDDFAKQGTFAPFEVLDN